MWHKETHNTNEKEYTLFKLSYDKYKYDRVVQYDIFCPIIYVAYYERYYKTFTICCFFKSITLVLEINRCSAQNNWFWNI